MQPSGDSGYNQLVPPTAFAISAINGVDLPKFAVEIGKPYDSLPKALSSLEPVSQTTVIHRHVVPDYMPLVNKKFSGFMEIMISSTPKLKPGTPVAVHLDFEVSATTKIVNNITTFNIENLLSDPKTVFDSSAASLYASTDTRYFVGILKDFPTDQNTASITFNWDATHASDPFSTAADGVSVDVSVTITSLSSFETLALVPI